MNEIIIPSQFAREYKINIETVSRRDRRLTDSAKLLLNEIIDRVNYCHHKYNQQHTELRYDDILEALNWKRRNKVSDCLKELERTGYIYKECEAKSKGSKYSILSTNYIAYIKSMNCKCNFKPYADSNENDTKANNNVETINKVVSNENDTKNIDVSIKNDTKTETHGNDFATKVSNDFATKHKSNTISNTDSLESIHTILTTTLPFTSIEKVIQREEKSSSGKDEKKEEIKVTKDNVKVDDDYVDIDWLHSIQYLGGSKVKINDIDIDLKNYIAWNNSNTTRSYLNAPDMWIRKFIQVVKSHGIPAKQILMMQDYITYLTNKDKQALSYEEKKRKEADEKTKRDEANNKSELKKHNELEEFKNSFTGIEKQTIQYFQDAREKLLSKYELWFNAITPKKAKDNRLLFVVNDTYSKDRIENHIRDGDEKPLLQAIIDQIKEDYGADVSITLYVKEQKPELIGGKR